MNLSIIIFLVSFIECQVILNRPQLAAWIPSYATATNISLGSRNISSIEASTFSYLNSLVKLDINKNQLSSLNTTTFNSLTNLEYLVLFWYKLIQKEASTFSNLKSLFVLDL